MSLCALCKKPGGSKCSRCYNIHYCSIDCQHAHWPTHKRSCVVYVPPEIRRKKWVGVVNDKLRTEICAFMSHQHHTCGALLVEISETIDEFMKDASRPVLHVQSLHTAHMRFRPSEDTIDYGDPIDKKTENMPVSPDADGNILVLYMFDDYTAAVEFTPPRPLSEYREKTICPNDRTISVFFEI